jgi:hypothetical protein
MPSEIDLAEMVVNLRWENRQLRDEMLVLRRLAALAKLIARIEGENVDLINELSDTERKLEDAELERVRLQNKLDASEELRRRGW